MTPIDRIREILLASLERAERREAPPDSGVELPATESAPADDKAWAAKKRDRALAS